MRTLKKVLALTIALATLFSLTAFAGYTDEEQINENCLNDVNLMGALNVMTGDTEGTFRPTATISRAEAAKMIYVVRNGGNDDKAAGWTGMKTFSDVASGIWYEGYVNYCASLGIIAGVGNGKFNPDGAVTGVELAKMLLVVAGYKPDVQGYTGANWANNVLNDAQSAGMFDGYNVAYTAAAPRQWAAKLFANTINNTMMAVYFNGELVTGVIGNETLVGTKYFGLETVTGVVTATNEVSFGAVLDVKTSKVTVEANEKTMTFAVPNDLLGQEVKVVYKDNDGTAGLSQNDKVYNVYATGVSKVYDVAYYNVKATNKDGETKATLTIPGFNGGKAAAIEAAPAVYTTDDYAKEESVSVDTLKTTFTGEAKNSAVRFIDKDGDGKLDYALLAADAAYGIVNTNDAVKFVFRTENAAGARKTVANGEEAYKALNFVDSVSKGDVVSLTVNAGVTEIRKVEPVTGTVSAINNTSPATVTVNGEKYGLSALNLNALPAVEDLGKEFKLYTDGKFVVYSVAADGSAAATELGTNFAYLINSKSVPVVTEDFVGDVTKVQVMLADGSAKVYEYSVPANTTGAVAVGAIEKDRVYEYVLTNGKIYFKTAATVIDGVSYVDKKAVTFDKETGKASYTPDTTEVTVLTDADTYFFVKAGENDNFKYSVVKASELKGDVETVSDKNLNAAIVTRNGIATLAFGVVSVDALPGSSSEAVVVMAAGKPVDTLVNGERVRTIEVTNLDGTAATYTVANDYEATVGKLYSVVVTNDVAAFRPMTVGTASTTVFGEASVKGFATGVVNLDDNVKDLASDVKIVGVDVQTSKNVILEDGNLVLATPATYKCDDASHAGQDCDNPDHEGYAPKTYHKNALYLVNDKGAVTTILVEADGEDISALYR